MNNKPTLSSPAPLVLTRALTLVLAVLCALSVGNLYLAQPLLAEIGRAFHADASRAGAVVTLAQVGYGTGVLLLVPLGDLLERRRLIVTLLCLVCVALVFSGLAPSLSLLTLAGLLVGVFTVVPQVIVPYAASLAADDQRAAAIGTMQAGLLVGILLARTFSGLCASIAGWRAVYFLAAGLCALSAWWVSIRFPSQPVLERPRYLDVLASMARLFVREPTLRRVSISCGLNFAAFSSFWTTLPFLLRASFGLGTDAAGAFGLVGVVGALSAGVSGRLADRRGTRSTQLIALTVTALSFALFAFADRSLVLLAAGIIVMDAGVQADHIACQAEAFTVDPRARSRINGVYMFVRFLGGAAGSAIGAFCWSHYGWRGFCVSSLALCAAAFVPYARVFNAPRTDAQTSPPQP